MTTATPTLTGAWPGVEHRHLASLDAVARARSFRGAARELGCSQSALSQHVSQLEKLVGTRLAERMRGRSDVALTAAGEVLLRHAAPILATYRAAAADLAALADDGPGTLRLGVAEHLVGTLPAAVLPAFLRRRPDAGVELTCASDDALAAALRSGALDAVVGDPTAAAAAAAGLTLTLLAPEPSVLIAPAAWAVVRRSEPAALIEHLPLALNRADPDAARIERELLAAGIVRNAARDAPSLTALVAQVVAGAVAAIVPAATAPRDARVVALALDGLVAPRPVAVLRLAARRHAPLADAFADAAVATRGPIAAADRDERRSELAGAATAGHHRGR